MPELLGKQIGSIGYGLMGLTWRPKPSTEEQAFEAMKASLAAGCNFWNAGEFYGTPEYNSLHLLERYFSKYPEDAPKVVLSIKGGLKGMVPDGTRENIRNSVQNCLNLLKGRKSIDIFECARVDKKVPIEITMKALEELVQEGKIGGIALSEVGAVTIERAAKVTRIVAVEVELNLFFTDILDNGVAKVCAERDIPIVAYSPLGRGFLTGELKKPDDIPEGDFRRTIPRFQAENFDTNLEIVREVEILAKRKGCTPAQIAINWVKSHSKRGGNPLIIPIPGATTKERVLENSKDVRLDDDDLAEFDSILEKFTVAGDRYGAHAMAQANG